MTIHIALLRGINVGGKNMIRMADLKRMFEDMGLCRIQTYIQSGNVLFESDKDEEVLRYEIEHEIKRVFGFAVTVVLRTAAEINQIGKNCPFSDAVIKEAESLSEGECLYVALLAESPSKEGIDHFKKYDTEDDEYLINGREVFLLFKHSIRNSKLANNLHRLGVPATVRNWKTINKLVELAKAMGC